MQRFLLKWNYWWLCYHMMHLRKHDNRIEKVIPDWKDNAVTYSDS